VTVGVLCGITVCLVCMGGEAIPVHVLLLSTESLSTRRTLSVMPYVTDQ